MDLILEILPTLKQPGWFFTALFSAYWLGQHQSSDGITSTYPGGLRGLVLLIVTALEVFAGAYIVLLDQSGALGDILTFGHFDSALIGWVGYAFASHGAWRFGGTSRRMFHNPIVRLVGHLFAR